MAGRPLAAPHALREAQVLAGSSVLDGAGETACPGELQHGSVMDSNTTGIITPVGDPHCAWQMAEPSEGIASTAVHPRLKR